LAGVDDAVKILPRPLPTSSLDEEIVIVGKQDSSQFRRAIEQRGILGFTHPVLVIPSPYEWFAIRRCREVAFLELTKRSDAPH
jgi:hypothetical protein